MEPNDYTSVPEPQSSGSNPGSKAERRAQKRALREEASARMARRKRFIRVARYAASLALTLLAVVLIVRWVKRQAPQSEDFSAAFFIQGADHIAVGSAHPPYNSNPPTSGWHYENAFEKSVSDVPLPDERLVHNLEHGHVWISYRPGIPEEIVEKLKDFATYNIVITPRPQNEKDIALAAWGRLDAFPLQGGVLDEVRIRDFIRRYANKGPEQVPLHSSR